MMPWKESSPQFVMTCGIAGAGMFAILGAMGFGPAADIVGHAFCVIAYVMALAWCARVAGTYPSRSFMRLGWLAMGGNCVLSIFRHSVLNPAFESWLGPRDRVYLLSQTFQLPALLLVLLGMLSIWWGLQRLGIGFRIGWMEWLAVAAVSGTVTWMFRNSLSHANSPHTLTAVLQAISLSLLMGIGGVGVLLHGLSMQMGGGRLALVMRCFAVYAITRSVLTLTQSHRDSYSLFWWICFYLVPWMFALGASYSSSLTETVKRKIRQHSLAGEWYEA